jgi:hypothetical protein
MQHIDIDNVVQAAIDMKESMDWVDLDPMVHVVTPDGEPDAVFCLVGVSGPELHASIYASIKSTPNAQAAIVISDARMRTYKKGEDPESVEHNLQAEWLAGRRENIVECLVIFAMDKNLEWVYRQVCYDAATRTWEQPEDPHEEGGEAGGGIYDAVRIAFSS